MIIASWNFKWFSNLNVYLATVVANLTATAVTCAMSWSSPALPMITHRGRAKIFVTAEEAAFLASIAALGACLGPLVTGRLADTYGRKKTLLGGMILLTATWVVFYFCDVLVILVYARFLAGVCAGCVYGTLPMYISEISPVELRGSLGTFLQFFDCVGYLVTNIGGSYLSYEQLSLLCAFVALLAFFFLLWIPESPYHLQNRGKEAEALRSLQFFRKNIESGEFKIEISELKLLARERKENYGSFWSSFGTKSNMKCVYYAAALIFFQQFCGINIFTFYSKTIFLESGSNISPDMSAVILAFIMLMASVITIVATRFFKIRTLLSCSSVGVTISMFVLAGFFYFRDIHFKSSHFLSWVPLASSMSFMITYTLGWGPLVWCITSVIFPANLKGVANGLCASFMWFLTFLLTFIFAIIPPAIGFSIFSGVTFISYFFVRFHLPETEGKTFHEIQRMIQGE